MNLYGFANGDPVNFSDPFGLYIQPIKDPALRRIIGGLLEGSATFKSIWYALARAPKNKVNLTVRGAANEAEIERVRSAGDGGGLTEGNANPNATILLELIEGMQPGSAEGIVAHEFGHAAGRYTRRRAANTGVPAVCGNADKDPIAPAQRCIQRLQERIKSELKASQTRDGKP